MLYQFYLLFLWCICKCKIMQKVGTVTLPLHRWDLPFWPFYECVPFWSDNTNPYWVLPRAPDNRGARGRLVVRLPLLHVMKRRSPTSNMSVLSIALNILLRYQMTLFRDIPCMYLLSQFKVQCSYRAFLNPISFIRFKRESLMNKNWYNNSNNVTIIVTLFELSCPWTMEDNSKILKEYVHWRHIGRLTASS